MITVGDKSLTGWERCDTRINNTSEINNMKLEITILSVILPTPQKALNLHFIVTREKKEGS